MTQSRASRLFLHLILLICCVFLNIACNDPTAAQAEDDDEEGGDDFLLSVDGSLKLSVISGYEAYQICKDIAGGFNQVIDRELQCLRKAIAAGQITQEYSEELCNESFLSCSPEDMRDYQICDEYDENSSKYEDCDAKVAEMDKCMSKTIASLEDEYEDLTCASGEMRDPDEIDPCDACQALEEKCPGITTNFDRQF